MSAVVIGIGAWLAVYWIAGLLVESNNRYYERLLRGERDDDHDQGGEW